VGTGEYTQFNNENTPFANLADAAVSSSSIQVVFPPHLFNGEYYMDGGSVWGVNLDSAIN